jgi:hypothetical protein
LMAKIFLYFVDSFLPFSLIFVLRKGLIARISKVFRLVGPSKNLRISTDSGFLKMPA